MYACVFAQSKPRIDIVSIVSSFASHSSNSHCWFPQQRCHKAVSPQVLNILRYVYNWDNLWAIICDWSKESWNECIRKDFFLGLWNCQHSSGTVNKAIFLIAWANNDTLTSKVILLYRHLSIFRLGAFVVKNTQRCQISIMLNGHIVKQLFQTMNQIKVAGAVWAGTSSSKIASLF